MSEMNCIVQLYEVRLNSSLISKAPLTLLLSQYLTGSPIFQSLNHQSQLGSQRNYGKNAIKI